MQNGANKGLLVRSKSSPPPTRAQQRYRYRPGGRRRAPGDSRRTLRAEAMGTSNPLIPTDDAEKQPRTTAAAPTLNWHPMRRAFVNSIHRRQAPSRTTTSPGANTTRGFRGRRRRGVPATPPAPPGGTVVNLPDPYMTFISSDSF